jgi:hypothetical protein
MAMRQHTLGPYPFDPNLIAQGVPVDDRVDFNDRIFAPVEGTPLPPGAGSLGMPPDPLAAPVSPIPSAPPLPPPPPGNSLNGEPIPPAEAPVAPDAGEVPPVPHGPPPGPVEVAPPDGALPAAPSAFNGNATGGPQVAIASYDPRTGRYLAPDGQLQQVTTAVAGMQPKSWKDLLPI